MNIPTFKVLVQIAEERERQDLKWGEQNHRDGTGGQPDLFAPDSFAFVHMLAMRKSAADGARRMCDEAANDGCVTWRDILREETEEAFAEHDPIKLREELVQVAAVCTNWIEAIDRRPLAMPPTEPGESLKAAK